MAEIEKIGFNLIRVTTDQFATICEPPPKDEKINVATNFRFGINPDSRNIGVFMKFTFIKAENTPFLSVEGGCHFQIQESDWENLKNPEKNAVILPQGFVHHLMMLCVGTTRGILHAKTENSPYNIYYIPLINVTQLIVGDLNFDFSKAVISQ